MRIILHWLRRDLRLEDNTALAAACAVADAVIPVYVVNPRILRSDWIAPARVATLSGGLSDLSHALQGIGARLIVCVGDDNAEELAKLAATVGAEAVYANRGVGGFDTKLEQQIAARLLVDGRQLVLHDDVGVLPPDAVLTNKGMPYTVYTPYARRWREIVASTPSREQRPNYATLRAAHAVIEGIPSVDHMAAFRDAGYDDYERWAPLHGGGRTAALEHLRTFIAVHGGAYREERNFPALSGVSRLSPAFRWGLLSYREAYRAAHTAQIEHKENIASLDAWIGELAWADFYRAILYHFPHTQRQPFKEVYEHLIFSGELSHLDAWKEGRTGYPLVDAGMRQLLSEGWMHNRLRMIVASFLVKDLLLDWRLGAHYFMQHLACGDTSANIGGWQWAASTGTDAQPYFRIFNPVTQSEKFDPQGVYIKRYVAELASVRPQFIHAPWLMPIEEQRRIGCLIGRDYPTPIVDHAAQRLKALAMFRAAEAGSKEDVTTLHAPNLWND